MNARPEKGPKSLPFRTRSMGDEMALFWKKLTEKPGQYSHLVAKYKPEGEKRSKSPAKLPETGLAVPIIRFF
jgi:hypothetical protein